jgi:hypothetical protein
VTRYDGYAFSNDGGSSFFTTTALDATEQGDPTHAKVLVYVC